MQFTAAPRILTIPGCRAGWMCAPSGFATIAPLSGSRSVVAVGSLGDPSDTASSDGSITDGSMPDAALWARMTAVVRDLGLVEGHDPTSLLHRVNAALAAGGPVRSGRVEAVALLTHPAEGVLASVTASGWPLPLVVTPDGVIATVRGPMRLGRGWTVVLGASGPPGGGSALSPAEVGEAVAMLSRPSPVMVPRGRTTLAVTPAR